MFIDALGREPTADEFQDIRLNLWMLTRAGFAVDDPSKAPLIAPWAWIWARLPRVAQVRAVPAPTAEVAEPTQEAREASECTPLETPANIDHDALASAIAERMPPLVMQHRIDGGTITAAVRDSFTLIWVWLAAFGMGLAGVLGWHYGALHERTAATRSAQQAELPHHSAPVIQAPTRARHRS